MKLTLLKLDTKLFGFKVAKILSPKLSQKKLQDAGFHQEKKVILPKSALSELARIGIEEQDLKLSFREEDNQVVFGVGDTILSTRILEGDFPEFEKIIPKETNIKVSLDKDDLLRAVKLASVFARDSANIVRFSLKKDGVVIAAESQMAGRQESQVEAKVEGLPTGAFQRECSRSFYRSLRRQFSSSYNARKGSGLEIY